MANYGLVPSQEEEEEEEEEEESEIEMKYYSGGGKFSASAAAKTVGAPPAAAGLAVAQTDDWETGIFSCLGKNDEFYSSDIEVCVLGYCAPCVLHGSNAERLASQPGAATFATHCLPYTALYLLGNCFFGWNCFAPCFAYPNRTALRLKFNLRGTGEALAQSAACSHNLTLNDLQRDHCESACDLATHITCHPCALCQEARELRRRLPHPGFAAKPVIVMLPPGGQTMGR